MCTVADVSVQAFLLCHCAFSQARKPCLCICHCAFAHARKPCLCSASELLVLYYSAATDGSSAVAEAVLYHRTAVAADAANPPTPPPPPPPPGQLPGAPSPPSPPLPPPFTVSNATTSPWRHATAGPWIFPGSLSCVPFGRGDASVGTAAGGAEEVVAAGYAAEAAGLGALAVFRLDAPRGDCGAYPLQPNTILLPPTASNSTVAGLDGLVVVGDVVRLGCRPGFFSQAAVMAAACLPTGKFNFTPARCCLSRRSWFVLSKEKVARK